MQNLKYFYTGEIYAYFTGELHDGWRKFYVINGSWQGWLSEGLDELWIDEFGPDTVRPVEVLWMSETAPHINGYRVDYNSSIELIQEMLDADASAPVGVYYEKVLAELAADADDYYASMLRGWNSYLIRPKPISALSDYKHILVVARSEDEARWMHPDEDVVWDPVSYRWRDSKGFEGVNYPLFWPVPGLLEVLRVGPYTGDLPPGTRLAVAHREAR